MLPNNAVEAAQQVLLPYLGQAGTVVDATAGNGKDTLFLARHTPPQALVWAFDIQAAALAQTRDTLAAAGLVEKVRFCQTSHALLASVVPPPADAIMFNLGYLPGGDRRITTEAATTLTAVSEAAMLLAPGGLMTIVVYPGHEPGRLEEECLLPFLTALPQRQFSVACLRMLNQRHQPPVLYAVERRRELKR
ncbi:MAG: class I SAM-dependent methyltransferase [Sporomusaceae bacterium]|nr:class I SAM-dependent methyltransferase [Sporomusaceae bacterium]